MEMTLTAETIVKILRLYYKEVEDFTGTIEIKTSVETETHYNEYYDVAKVVFIQNGTMEYLNEQIPYRKEVTKKEVEDIIGNFFSTNNMELQELIYDTKLGNEESSGNASLKKSVEFNGINCRVKKIKKEKTKK